MEFNDKNTLGNLSRYCFGNYVLRVSIINLFFFLNQCTFYFLMLISKKHSVFGYKNNVLDTL